jgi:DNA replication and repair protein RecF
VYLSLLSLQNFRNYKELSLSFSKEGALFFGDNGVGKTNIIESIHFLLIGRSQRGAGKTEMIHTESAESYIEGVYTSTDETRRELIGIGFSKDKKVVLKKDSCTVMTFSELFGRSSVVSFSPNDSLLVYSDPSERRRFLDIVLSQGDREYFKMLGVYKKDLLNRNALLIKASSDRAIEIYEESMARSGAYIISARMSFIDSIKKQFSEYFDAIVERAVFGTIRYKSNLSGELEDVFQIEKIFLLKLRENRKKEISLGYSTNGPHRDDIVFYINENVARFFGSQGQCRSLSIALRLCALGYFEKKTPNNTIILVDDAFAELDKTRTEQICSILRNRGQLFITALTHSKSYFNYLPGFSFNCGNVVPYEK